MNTLLLLMLLQGGDGVDRKVDVRTQVVILVNEAVPASIQLGEYYAEKRGIPTSQILKVKTATGETISRDDYNTQIVRPVQEFLKDRPRVLYLVPVFGVPVKTTEKDASNDNKGKDPMARFVTGRDYACIDRELELIKQEFALDGWIESKTYKQDRHITLTDNILIVSRLDGPTPERVRAMIDNALYGESYGVEGVCLLDTRGLEQGGYAEMDKDMKTIGPVFEKYGFKFNHDDQPEVVELGTHENASHYWGWYAGNAKIKAGFKFNRGAVGAHLHSFSAQMVRDVRRRWVAPLIQAGITGTCGTVYEPLGSGFPNGAIFLDRFFQGYTFGEAMQMANQFTSWQAVFLGDPLYAPYSKGVRDAQKKNRELAKEGAANLWRLVDSGKYDEADDLAEQMNRLPMSSADSETKFLLRELKARRLDDKAKTGNLKELQGVVRELDAEEDPKKIQTLARKGLALSRFNFDCNFRLGMKLAQEGEFKKALPYLEKVSQVEAGMAAVWHYLGMAWKASRKEKEALSAFERAFEIDPAGTTAKEIGEIYFKQKKYKEAAEKLESALAGNPNDVELALVVAKAHVESRNGTRAIEILEPAVANLPATRADVPPWTEAWETLWKANKIAGKIQNMNICGKMVDGFRKRKGKGLQGKAAEAVEKYVQEIADAGTAENLRRLNRYADNFIGQPTLYFGNRSDWEIEVMMSGPITHRIKMKAVRGRTTPKTSVLPVYPGTYKIVAVAKRGRETRVLFSEQVIDVNRNFAIGFQRNLGNWSPPKP